MSRNILWAASAFAILGACTPAFERTNSGPMPEFTPQEKTDIILTAQFLQCSAVNIERIQAVHPNDKDYVMEFCANMTGFNDNTFTNLTNQMTIKYGDDWPDMLESISGELSLQEYEPPLIPNDFF